MAHETSKAMRRRWREDGEGKFPWKKIFQGKGIDVGCGPDKLPFPECQPFDLEQGDANKLSEYFPKDHFDYLHASQCLEHMHNPSMAIREWIEVVRPGGHLVITVPDIGSYERFRYPSVYNPDHRSSWSTIYLGSCFPIHVHIPTFLKELEPLAETVLARYVETNYDWKQPDIDQTWVEAGAELWNEFVLRKK